MDSNKEYTIEVPSNWGGPRPNAGRKEVPDKKQQVYVMVRGSQIEILGGKDKVKDIMCKAVEKALEELDKAKDLLE